MSTTNVVFTPTMTEKKRVPLSRFELEIMEVLWRLGEASVREVQEAIHERKRPAYTTVQT
ncbi:MAG TPA: BlaI/MecI/CopY family transcriptional regulator, partial [Thermoanaerobaculia bacterium]|nr:BlaI/MecI/CopY family transcriptional regulator [Thermoanaerobaculia bacterium]